MNNSNFNSNSDNNHKKETLVQGGYLDDEMLKKLVIEGELEEAFDFYNGVAVVCSGGKYGFVNEKGELVVPFRYDDVFRLDGKFQSDSKFEDIAGVSFREK